MTSSIVHSRTARYLALAATIAACSKSNDGTAPPPVGALGVEVITPPGVTAQYFVTGPNNFDTTLAATATIGSLTPGGYYVNAGAGRTSASIVSISYPGVVTGSPATVTAGDTAQATVGYTLPNASSGRLYVSNTGASTIVGYTAAQLAATGAPVPTVTFGNGSASGHVQNPARIAMDASGGLWWVNNTDTIFHYTAAQMTSSTIAAPAARIVSTALVEPIGLAFDRQGNLWVADQGNNTVGEFMADDIAGSSTVTPVVVLHNVLGSIKRPWQVAFDAQDNLWVVNYGDSTIVGFQPYQYMVSGSPLPFAGLSGSQGITNCISIAFDAQGNLWVGTLTDTISKFTPSQLTAIGAPTPSVILSGYGFLLPIAMAFDNSGNLWAAGYGSSTVVEFAASQLTTTGHPTKTVVISAVSSSIFAPEGLAFSPGAPGLPLR